MGRVQRAGLAEGGAAEDVLDLLDCRVYLGDSSWSSGELNQDVLDVLDALSLHQQPLHVLFGLLQLSLQLAVLLLNVLVVLVQLLVLVPQHQQLLFLVLNVAHQVTVGLVGLFEQRPCDFELIVGLF